MSRKLLLRRRALLLNSSAVVSPTPNRFDDVFLQLAFLEPDTSTSGDDDSANAFNWTGVGNAVVTGGDLQLDGTNDYITFASDAHDWNFIHGGATFTIEVLLDEWPTGTDNVLLDTGAFTSNQTGTTIDIKADGTVRVIVMYSSTGNFIIDYTSADLSPPAGLNHLVIEVDYGNATDLRQRVRVGLNGSRKEQGDLDRSHVEVNADASNDAYVGGHHTSSDRRLNGEIRGLRIWRNHRPYDLANETTYTYDTDPADWPTAEVATGAWPIESRYWPIEETTAAGKPAGGLTYYSEPRFIDIGGGEVLAFRNEGTTHASNTTTRIDVYKSTDYGRTFPASSYVSVDDDATYSSRNICVGRDPASGRLICFFRTANASNVTQDIYYRTSTDDGATWSSRTSVFSSLTAGSDKPFGRIIKTSVGLMATFYVNSSNVAEALFSTDGGQTWGSRTTIHSDADYNEPIAVAVTADNIVVMCRKDAGDNNVYGFWKSSDGGATWGSVSTVQWTSTVLGDACPGTMAVIGSNVLMVFGARSPLYNIYYSITDASAFFTDPTRALDGTENIAVLHNMRNDTAWSVNDADYGYPDVIDMGNKQALIGWYESVNGGGAPSITRTWNKTIDASSAPTDKLDVSVSVTNPGFETGDLTGWTQFAGSWSVDTTTPNSGTYSATVTYNGTAYLEQYVDVSAYSAQIDAGRVYLDAECYCKNDGDDTSKLRIVFYDDTASISPQFLSPDVSSTTYTKTEHVALAVPRGTTRIRVMPRTDTISGVGAARFDDIALRLYE